MTGQNSENEPAGNSDDDGGEGIQEDHISRLHGNVRATAHRNSDISSLERRSIVDTIASHGDNAVVLELTDDTELLFGCGSGKHNFFVPCQVRPLIFVESHEFRTTEDDGTGMNAGLILALERHGAFWAATVCETMEGCAIINGMSGDNTGIAGNGQSILFLMAVLCDNTYHCNSDTSAAQSANNMRNIVSQRIDNGHKSNQGKARLGFTGDRLLVRNVLNVFGKIATFDGLACEQQTTLALAGVHVLEFLELGPHSGIKGDGLRVFRNIVGDTTSVDELSKAEDGLVSGITKDLSLGQRCFHGGGIELGGIAKRSHSSELDDGIIGVRESKGKEAYGSKSTGLVRANNGYRSQGFDSLEGLAENLVLLHQVCSNGETSCDRDRKTFRDESNSDTDAVDDECWDIDEIRMLASQKGAPVERQDNANDRDHDNHNAGDNYHKVQNFPLESGHLDLGFISQTSDASKHSPVTSRNDDSSTRSENATHVGWKLVAGFDTDDIARDDFGGTEVDELTVADYVAFFGQHFLD
ncbi:hypothetical protein HG530_012312 [Fusarium avenaceum]|nr:hypothetical protein HG530_012312 [Fusarium avenaceum]